MLEKAKAKIQAEIDQNKTNPYIQVVGGFMIQYLNSNPNEAEKILATDKTIEKSLDEMKKEAEKKKVGNCAVLTDQEGFAVVLKYFGIESSVPQMDHAPIKNNTIIPPAGAEKKKAISFDVNLEDFL